jgi:predicted metal-dependent hydrolase
MQQALSTTIHPRDFRFARGEDRLAKDWNGGDFFRTAFFNSMSILFPIGEKTFIDSVMAHRKHVVEPGLKADVKGFIAQESVHRREHQRFNEELCAARGYDLAHLERRIRQSAAADKHLDPLVFLASTVAYEHLTATIAHSILTEESWFAGADSEVANMWKWHAIEEIEHKAVAFDVYIAAGGTRALLKQVMVFMSWEFLVRYMARSLVYMFLRDRPPFWSTLKSAIRFTFGRRGFFRRSWQHYWLFFRSDFHPNNIDQREVLAASLNRLQVALTD